MTPERQRVVLLIDDQSGLRRLVSRMLTRNGFGVIEAGGAKHGLEIIQRAAGAIDLVITDVVMPGMSGLDLAADLTRAHPALKVLYMSGYVDSIAMQVIGERSPEAVLLKPFSEEDLLGRVNHLLGCGPE